MTANYANYPGHGLTKRSRDEWKKLKARRAVENARQLIEWARAEYIDARWKHALNIKVSVQLVLYWNPERVLSRHKEFARLIHSLNNEIAWSMLTRKERKFIAGALDYYKKNKKGV